MGLPGKGEAWPPADHTARYSRMKTAATWYAGSPAQLGDLYGSVASRGQEGVLNRALRWFWSTPEQGPTEHKLHVPLPRDIAVMNSELLFSEGVRFVVQHTRFTEDGTPDESQDAEVAATQARLDELLDYSNFESVLLAAAETCSPLGSVGLRIGWQKSAGLKMPVIMRVDADAIVPEYRWGQLTAVTFWRTASVGSVVYFHLERHERGRIFHGLYAGQDGNLGNPVPLTDHEMTRDLAPLVDEQSSIALVDDETFTAVSVPNALPDPEDRHSLAGRSDYSPGVLTLFDAIDRTYTSLLRDIEDGRSRLIIADYMLNSNGAGRGVSFDEDQHLFTRVKAAPAEDGTNPPIEQVQFRIRVDEHLRTLDNLISRAVRMSGYSPDADQADSGGQQTATEYVGKARRSMQTRRKKLRYWQSLEGLMESLLKVDAAYFGSGVVPLPVRMEVPAAVQPSMRELAETVSLLRQTEATSIAVRVRALHPDWDQKDVDAEVDRIQSESSVVDPATFGLPAPVRANSDGTSGEQDE